MTTSGHDMSRAALLPTPGDPFLLTLWSYFFKNVWGKEIDKLYICINNIFLPESTEYIKSLFKDCSNVEIEFIDLISHPNVVGDHGKIIAHMLNQVEEDYILLIEDDGFIFKPGYVNDYFLKLENYEYDLIGSRRGSCSDVIIEQSKIKYNKAVVAVFIALLLWIVVPIIHARGGEFYTAYCSKIGSGYLIFPGKSILGYAAFILSKFSYELILFPWTIITLALLEMYSIKPSKSFAFLGHISYSSYLLHFPLQIIFVLSTSYFLIDRDFFYSPVSLILFFLCLIPLSLLSYKFFESPIQRYLRNLS
jgi:hypothetical protein